MRSGWAYSVASSLRRKPKSVMLASCASRTASAVGRIRRPARARRRRRSSAPSRSWRGWTPAPCRMPRPGRAAPARRPACPARCAGPRPRAPGRWCRRRRPSLRRGWRRSGRAGAGACACRAWRPARPGRAAARRRPRAAPAATLQAGFPRRTGRSRCGRPWRGGATLTAPRRRWRFPAAPRCRRIAAPHRCRARRRRCRRCPRTARAQCEVFQVGGRGQHGGVADAVVFQRDRGLLGQVVGFRGGRDGAGPDSGHLGGDAVVAVFGGLAHALRAYRCGWQGVAALPARGSRAPGRHHSPSSPRRSRGPLAQQLCWMSAKRDHWRCHSEGWDTRVTCTAVTLYSGQLVAQSELSVVTTLAPDSEVEGGVYHARLDPVGQRGAQHGLAGAALDADPVALGHAAVLGVLRVDLQHVLAVPHDVGRAAGLRADVVLRQDSPSGEQQRKRRVLRSSVGTYLVIMKRPLPRTNWSMCMMGCRPAPRRCTAIAGCPAGPACHS